eukprot:6074475-Pyramimonas_sp.AAC.1
MAAVLERLNETYFVPRMCIQALAFGPLAIISLAALSLFRPALRVAPLSLSRSSLPPLSPCPFPSGLSGAGAAERRPAVRRRPPF